MDALHTIMIAFVTRQPILVYRSFYSHASVYNRKIHEHVLSLSFPTPTKQIVKTCCGHVLSTKTYPPVCYDHICHHNHCHSIFCMHQVCLNLPSVRAHSPIKGLLSPQLGLGLYVIVNMYL